MNALEEFKKAVDIDNVILVYASLSYSDGWDEEESSKIETTDIKELVSWLDSTDYDDDFGTQELFGVIYLRDSKGNPVWLDRWEYDGSEGWNVNTIPEIYTSKQ